MILQFEINWGQGFVVVESPMNADGIMIDLLFTDQFSNAVIRNLDLEWTGTTATKMLAYKQAGLSGGVGITEGLPLRISACDPFFNGYIDLQSPKTRWSCDKVLAPCIEFGRADWVMDRARGFTFKFLRDLPVNSPGKIIPSIDYKKTPYTITKYRTRSEAITMELELAGLALQIADTVRQLSACINNLLGATNPFTLPLILFELANILLYVAYLLELFIVVIKLISAYIRDYYQFKKYKLCMTWESCFTRIAQRLGMSFKSTILQQGPYVGMTWMPQKNTIPDLSNPLTLFHRPADEGIGFPANTNIYGYPDGDCGTWIEMAQQHFDAQLFIFPNPSTGLLELHFENKFHFNNIASWTIQNTGPVGNTYLNPQPYGTNLSECPSNYAIAFQVDQADEGTERRYAGTTCSVTVRQVITNDPLCVAHSTGKDVMLPTALAKRKEYLNPIEHYLNDIFSQFSALTGGTDLLLNAVISQMNAVVSIFGGPVASPLGAIGTFTPVSARMEWLELSNDGFSIPKVFIGYESNGEWLIKSTNQQYVSAIALGQNFHFKNLATRGNQAEKYFDKELPFCCQDYNKLKYNNVVTTPTGAYGKLMDKATWDVHNDKLINVNYVTFVTLTNNLQETISVDGS